MSSITHRDCFSLSDILKPTGVPLRIKQNKNKEGYRILAYTVFTGHFIILQAVAICLHFVKIILDTVIFRFKSAFYSPNLNAVVKKAKYEYIILL